LKKLSRVQRLLDGVDIKRGRQSYQKGRGGQKWDQMMSGSNQEQGLSHLKVRLMRVVMLVMVMMMTGCPD
jgi:hypothetical protein